MRHLCSLIIVLNCGLTSNAQTVDTSILGTVSDSTGAAVAGATVVITQHSTGFSHTAVTAVEGNFEICCLIPGEYVVVVNASGYQAERRTGVVNQLGQQARLESTIKVGNNVQETVDVNAGVPLLRTENATIAGVICQERIESLPINGRHFDDLAVLTPGVSVYNTDNHSSSTDGSEIGGNGSRLIHVPGVMRSDRLFRLTGERRI